MSENRRDYSAANEAVIRRWEREEARKRARAEAAEENVKQQLANEIRQINNRRSIARQFRDGYEGRYPTTALHERVARGGDDGICAGDIDESEITGYEGRESWREFEDEEY